MQKNKLNLHIYGIHLLNPYKTVVSHLKCDWFVELSSNKLSDNNLASELVENRSFLIQSQLREL